MKLKYNERLLMSSPSSSSGSQAGADPFDSSKLLDTCCHPISMDSLIVKYLATNGSVVSTVIPNMIITGCGCS